MKTSRPDNDLFLKSIGASIKEHRVVRGLSQKQMAALIGVSHVAVSYWENGVNIPNVADCWRLADALGISVDELVGRDKGDEDI